MSGRRIGIGLICLAGSLGCLAAGVLASPGEPEAAKTGAKIRIGTYRSRAVALAFGRSELFSDQMKKLMLQHDRAKEAKDEVTVKALEKQGSEQQNLRHMQVFGNAPIHDILVHLQDALQEEAPKGGLDLIVRDIDIAYRGPSVELVDITDALVQRFQPTEETLKQVRDIDNHPPLPLQVFPIDCGHGHKDDPPSTVKIPAEKAAGLCAEAWLRIVDEERYVGSWERASGHFQAVVPRDKWIQEIRSLRESVGKVVKRKLQSKRYTTSLPDAPEGEYVLMIFETSFEKKKSAKETVTAVLDKDGRWRVDGYYLR